MAKDNKLWIDMCAGSELKDTQGETLSVEGADISDLQDGKGRLNDNHGKGFFNSLGRVTEAKKIFKSEDCENERHKYYWEKIKAPFIYAKGYLFNNEDHPNAKAAAAILRNIHREDAPLVMKASVEGGVVARGTADPARLARTKIHSVALTFTPANNATLVEPVDLNKANQDWEADKQLIKSVMHLAETNVPSFRHIQRHASANSIYDNILKIQDLSRELGIDVHIQIPDPEVIMKNAIFKKIENNIRKINKLVKSLNVDHQNLIGEPDKLQNDPKNAAGNFDHPELVTRWHGKGKIPVDHADRQEMVNYINKLKNTPDRLGLNVNVNEARRLYNDHIAENQNLGKSDLSRAAKGTAIAIAMGHAAHYISEPPVEVKNHAVKVHRELESQKSKTVAEHNSRLNSSDIKLSNKEYGFDEKEPAVSHIQVKKQKLKNKLKKALLAGYGGAGAPTDLTGGGVIQPQSLDAKRKKKIKNRLVKAVIELEELAKGKKELLAMYKDPAHGKDHVDWVTKTLPTAWHTWAVKNHRDNSAGFTPEIKEELNHFSGMAAHANEIKQTRFNPNDNFDTGLNKLREAQEKYNSKQENDSRHLVPDSKTKKISNDITGTHGIGNWYSLGKSYCEDEGKAMHHCGNIAGESRKTDNILSFRTERKDGKHKPHLTFIENNGWLGETKGYANSAPTKDYHRAIVELLKDPKIKGIAGGGYQSEMNFKFSDLSPEHRKEVLGTNPNLIIDIDGYENQAKALSNNLPHHHKENLITDPGLDPRLHEQLANDENNDVRKTMAARPDLDPRLHERLVNDNDPSVRKTMAARPDLDPRLHEQIINNKKAHYIRAVIASNPSLDPRFHEQLVNDKDIHVREIMASLRNLDPRFHEQLANDDDPDVSRIMIDNPNYKLKKTLENFDSLGKNLCALREALNKSINYISCDNCGHEQVFMPHQVKCRECKHNFSLYRLNSLKS